MILRSNIIIQSYDYSGIYIYRIYQVDYFFPKGHVGFVATWPIHMKFCPNYRDFIVFITIIASLDVSCGPRLRSDRAHRRLDNNHGYDHGRVSFLSQRLRLCSLLPLHHKPGCVERSPGQAVFRTQGPPHGVCPGG